MYVKPEMILEAKKMDLYTYLSNFEPHELVKFSGNTYTTRTHDSLKISNGKWMWWSRGIGGRTALDYLIKVKGMSFVDAVQTIVGCSPIITQVPPKPKEVADRPLLLPKRSLNTDKVRAYLSGRGIDDEIIDYCIKNKLIFESLDYNNVVFIGYDEKNTPRYAAYRSTNNFKIMGDCSGSKKEYPFKIASGTDDKIHLFECAIDLLSYSTICKMYGIEWRELNLVSLAGVYSARSKIEESKVPVALLTFLKAHPEIKQIHIHFDNDKAGRYATKALKTVMSDKYEVIDSPPLSGKDFNDFLCIKKGITKHKSNERNDVR